MTKNNAKLSPRLWIGMLMCSFIGGLAWNVENMYFNTFLWNEVYEGSVGVTSLTYTDAVNIMVTFSAIVAVVTTFIMGTLSEKMKNRKAFISFGYIAWGIITALFGFITKDNVANIFGLSDAVKIVITTAWVVVVMDMIMTFMGSTSNDSAFQAWVTDVTTPETTQKVETAFTFVGFIAMAVIMVVGSMAQGGAIPYSAFFIGLGVVVTLAGIVALFVVDNPKKLEDAKKDESTPKTSYWADLFYGFRPDVIKENSKLYLILVATGIFNCAFQVFFPYLLTYFGEVVIKANEELFAAMPISLIVVGAAAVITLVAGIVVLLKIYNKSKAAAFIPSVISLIIGLLVMFFAKTNLYLMLVGAAFTLVGYIVIMIQFGANVRDSIPQDKVGLFQGVRMIFFVLIPMVVGPTLGNIATKNSTVTITDISGAESMLPTEMMFLYAAIVAVFIFIPLIAYLKKDKENV
ncbi:MAG: MFS transporter [Clostridia bacterium]|nr:MFS transporter [Clostridia bacterium]